MGCCLAILDRSRSRYYRAGTCSRGKTANVGSRFRKFCAATGSSPWKTPSDPSHLYWLHGDTAHLAPTVDHYEEEHEFTPFEHGIMKRRVTPGRKPGDPPSSTSIRCYFRTLCAMCSERNCLAAGCAIICRSACPWTMRIHKCSSFIFLPARAITRRRMATRRGNTFLSGMRKASIVSTTCWCRMRWRGRPRGDHGSNTGTSRRG